MEEQKKEPKSTLGERMNDLSGIRILRNGEWVSISKKTEKPAEPEAPKETK
jgi:hypothetical protein